MKHRHLLDYIHRLMDCIVVFFLVVAMGASVGFVGFLTGYFTGLGDKQKVYDKGYKEAIELRIDFSNLKEE